MEDRYSGVVAPISQNADFYEDLQRLRISVHNRISSIEKGRSTASEKTLTRWKEIKERLKEDEESIAYLMQDDIQYHPIWPWLEQVKGIGPVTATKIIGVIGDIGRFPTVSKLWAYMGYAVREGRAERSAKHQKDRFNRRLRTIMFQAGGRMLQANSQYARFYYEARDYYIQNRDWVTCEHPKCADSEIRKGKKVLVPVPISRCIDPDGHSVPRSRRPYGYHSYMHVHLASLRRMMKMFASHLWVVWRASIGLDTKPPWIYQFGGHDNMVMPDDVVPETDDYQYPYMWRPEE